MTAPGRRRWAGVGFMIVWLTFWTAGILVAVWHLGAQALAGEPAAAVFLVVWLAAAIFALRNGALQLKALLMNEKTPARPHRNHAWRDGMDEPGS
jgi:hypothetical protein